MNINPENLWQRTLTGLEGQMTRATFNTWLRGSSADPHSNGTLVVRVKNWQAQQWLDGKLRPVIERELQRQAEHAIPVEFVVAEDPSTDAQPSAPAPQDPDALRRDAQITVLLDLYDRLAEPDARAAVTAQLRSLGAEPPTPEREPEIWQPPDDVDTAAAGWFPVPNYANTFWAPLLGRIAFRVWMIVREHDTRPARVKRGDTWTPPRRFSAPQLARQVPCHRHSISGVWRRCQPEHDDAVLRVPKRLTGDLEDGDRIPYRRQTGALTVLQEHGLALVTQRGEGRHSTYEIQVQITPPLLSRDQWRALDEDLRVVHDKWVRTHTDHDPHELYH